MVGLMLYHKHLLVNAKIKWPMYQAEDGVEFLRSLVEAIDMKILQGPFATYVPVKGNKGLTAIVLIETSHIAFHIWDEPAEPLLQFDLYTCGELNHLTVLERLKTAFQVTSMEWVLFDREHGFRIDDQGNFTSQLAYEV